MVYGEDIAMQFGACSSLLDKTNILRMQGKHQIV